MESSSAFQWPIWASASCVGLLVCLLSLHLIEKLVATQKLMQKATKSAGDEAFAHFQREYLLVYGLVMFADWLQGTHMYSLYQSYGMNVGALFLTGFLSSVVFGNFVGLLVDKYGRRKACLVYCALEIVINLLENVPNTTVLLTGSAGCTRFSGRAAWQTFALGSEINGVVAVIAGLAAQIAADVLGDIGPFRAAVVVTAVAAVFVSSWSENYGSSTVHKTASSDDSEADTTGSLSMDAYALGLCYSLFEGAMYVFVFLWYPTLEVVVPNRVLPSGLVFSSFMLCVAIGGKMFDLIDKSWLREELLLTAMVPASAVCLLIPTATENYQFILGSFLVFEVCVGVILPCCATLRSRHFPKVQLSTTLSLFRLPTNVLVVLGTGGGSYWTSDQLFYGCSVLLVVATGCALKLVQTSSTTPARKLKAQ
ncbi:Molybdate-anion transporter [Phytophthora ramorum]|uniref:Molybdate-anion transporter n=1 Tax=Phytophthora ramorum TaxID=164328 RepID=UPI0030B45133|nr:Molybdate-anion transporter [Phytophthora ramorum]